METRSRAKVYLELCEAASQPVPYSYVQEYSLHGRMVFDVAGGRAVVYESADETVVVFRGSGGHTVRSTLLNVLDDLDMRTTTEWELHRGVYRHAERFRRLSPLAAELTYRCFFTRKLTLTGMSLGGACAIMYAAQERGSWGTPFDVVTFGAPLVTKKPEKFMTSLQSWGCRSVENYVLRGDLFTRIPPFPGWSHVGNLHTLPAVRGAEHSRSRYMEALE